jgi:hypothetical protein
VPGDEVGRIFGVPGTKQHNGTRSYATCDALAINFIEVFCLNELDYSVIPEIMY